MDCDPPVVPSDASVEDEDVISLSAKVSQATLSETSGPSENSSEGQLLGDIDEVLKEGGVIPF